MSKIEDLQQIEIEKVQPKLLQDMLKGLLLEFKESQYPDIFLEERKENIDKIYDTIKRMSSGAIINKKKDSKSSVAKKDKVSKTIQKELEELDEEIKACRVKIKKYNTEKRKNEPAKPKITRHVKIKKHLIAIGNLIPDKFKDDIKIQKETEKVLLLAYRKIMDTYKITTLKAQKGEKEIKEKYDKIEEKINKSA